MPMPTGETTPIPVTTTRRISPIVLLTRTVDEMTSVSKPRLPHRLFATPFLSCDSRAVCMPAPEAFHPAIRAVARAYFGVRFEGVENIPLEGPLVIAPN